MNTPAFRRWAGRLLSGGILALLLSSWSSNVRADVVVVQRVNGPAVPIIVGIIEDSDPVGTWTRTLTRPDAIHLNVNGDLNGDGRPSMAHDPDSGRTAVAWARFNGSDHDVVVSVFDGGAWSDPVVVAGGTGDQLDPALAIDPADGSLHVAYWNAAPDERVYHAVGTPAGDSWSPPVPVSEPGDIAVRPGLAFHQGSPVIAYESHNFGIEGLPKQIVVATHDGGAWTHEAVEQTQRTGTNRVGVHSVYGRLWVDWIDDDGSLGFRAKPPGGPWGPTEFEPFADGVDLEYDARSRIRFRVVN